MNQALLPFGVTQDVTPPRIIRSFCFPLILTSKQITLLHHVFDLGHEIRERVVADRLHNREANRLVREAGGTPAYLTLTDQRRAIAAMMKADNRFRLIHSQVAQDQCERIDKADKAWLKGLKSGNKRAKPARHRERKFFRSITYPQYGNGVRLSAGKIWFSKLGTFRLHDYQKIPGAKKTVSIVWKHGRFWAVLTAEQVAVQWFETKSNWQNQPTVGADTGLKSLLTLSDGTVFDPPRRLKEAFQALASLQKSISRKFEARKVAWAVEQAINKANNKPHVPLRDYPRSNRLTAEIRRLAKAHTKVERCRGHDHAKIASVLQSRYSQVAMEEHGVQFMIRNRRLAKSASDRAIGNLKLRIKSTLPSERLFMVSTTDQQSNGNSQTCTCGAAVPKKLNDRIHACASCGRTGDRDVVAADRVHLRTFGNVTPVRGQRIGKRGDHDSRPLDRGTGESASAGCRVIDEAQTFQACLALAKTSGGKPTELDKTSAVGHETRPVLASKTLLL